MAENVEFLIDAQYPNRRAVEDFLKDVKEIKATLASFGKEARAVRALSTSVAALNKSLSKKVALADAAAKAELQAQKAATEAARTRAANAKAEAEEAKAAAAREKTLQQKLRTQQQRIDNSNKRRLAQAKQARVEETQATRAVRARAAATQQAAAATAKLAAVQRRAFGSGVFGGGAFGSGVVPGGGAGFNFRPPAGPVQGPADLIGPRRGPVLEEIGRATQSAGAAAAQFRQQMERARRSVSRTTAQTKKLAASTSLAARGASQATGQFRLLNGTVGRSLKSVTALAAIFTTIEGIRLGTAFADQLVQAQAQIAGLIASSATLSDATGALVPSTQAYGNLLGLANDQIEKLKQNALETASTFGQLLENFQTAIGPGLAAGLNVDQIRELTVSISQAATAIGLEQRQLAEEVRSLFTGAINPRNSRIATVLGITPEQVKEARKAGELAAFLENRLAGITTAAKTLQGTLLVTFSNLGDRLQQVAGVAFEPFRQGLLDLATVLSDSLGDGGVGRALIDGLGGALARAADATSNFIQNVDADKLREFGSNIREIAGFLSSLLAGILPGVAAGFLALSTLASRLARSLKTITDTQVGRTLLTIAATSTVLVKAMLALRTAFLAARAAQLALTASIPGVGIALAAAAVAASAGFALAAEFSEENENVAKSIEAINNEVKEAESGLDLFFNQSIDQAGQFAEAMKNAADQVKRLQSSSVRSIAQEGVDSGFRDAVGNQLQLDQPLKQLRDRLVEITKGAADARSEFNRLLDEENVARNALREFQVVRETQTLLPDSLKRTKLENDAIEGGKKAQAALERSIQLESQRKVAQQELRKAVLETAKLESQALKAIEPRLQRQSQLRREQAAASIRAAEEQLKANVGRPGGLEGSERVELERKIALIEREVQLQGENLTVSGLLNKAKALDAEGQTEGADAARRLAEAAQAEFDQRALLFELNDKLRQGEQERLSVQEQTALRISEQALELRKVTAFADRLDNAATFLPLQAQFGLLDAAQQARVTGAQQGLALAQQELALARQRGDSQQVINDLRDRELDATEGLVAAETRLQELRRREAERTQVVDGLNAGLRSQQVGAGESANQFVGASINALRQGLTEVVSAAFDPNQSVNLGQALLGIGQSITQALVSGLIEQGIIQPLINTLLGASATPAVLIQSAFATGASATYTAIVAGFKTGALLQAGTGLGFAGGRIPGFNSGGVVGGANLSSAPAGLHPQDRVLTALTPGEGVLNRGAMQALGSDWLHSVNRDFGKISVGRGRRAGKIQGLNSGGVVGSGGGGARPSIRSGGGSSILVADRESARVLLRNRAFDERAVASRRTLKAL